MSSIIHSLRAFNLSSFRVPAIVAALAFFIIGGFALPVAASQTGIAGPAGSSAFGTTVTVLPNGNIVVTDPSYSIPAGAASVGAAYLYDGATLALISTLTGSTASDSVGSSGITVLANGNYVVRSQTWNGSRGAVTFCNAATGCGGTVSSANSLVGSTANDNVGNIGITALTNGNYVVGSQFWDNGAITDARAYTFGNGASGTSGAITSGASGGNSVVGTVTSGVTTFAFDPTRNRLVVGRSLSNTVSVLFFNTTATSNGAINSAATFDNGLPNGLVNAIIPNGRTVSLSGVSNIGLVSVDCTATLTGASAANYIVGSVRRNFCAASGASFVYPIGDANNYAPLTASNVVGTGALTVAVIDDTLPGLPNAQSVSRYWQLDGTGIVASLTFQYTAADVSGTEATYRVHRRVGTNNIPYATTVNTVTHTATVNGISNFSPWGIGNTLAPAAPTAASVTVSGRVTVGKESGLTNAIVTLTNSQGETRTTRTSTFGYYRFDDVEGGQTYIISIISKRYFFTPQVVDVAEATTEINFAAP